jgi:hypothetical protein
MDDPMIWSRLGQIRNVAYEGSRTQAGALSSFLPLSHNLRSHPPEFLLNFFPRNFAHHRNLRFPQHVLHHAVLQP